jgi:glutamate carboxypeptidase
MAGNQVRVEWGVHEGKPPILLLGHYDTVWPAGALEAMPFSVHEDTARGPGIFDMKCGLVQGFWGIKALREAAGWIAKWFSCATQTKILVAHTPVLS